MRCKPKTGCVRMSVAVLHLFPIERVAHARTTIAMHASRVRVGETEIREDIFFVAPALLCGGTGRAPRFLVRCILVKMQWR